jgi:hypothetical protein
MTGEIVLVAGPPCAGKTTYVRDHAQPGDTVLDQDVLGPRHYQAALDDLLANPHGPDCLTRLSGEALVQAAVRAVTVAEQRRVQTGVDWLAADPEPDGEPAGDGCCPNCGCRLPGRAWVIRCLPGPTAREAFAEHIGASRTVLLQPDTDVLMARAGARPDPARHTAAVRSWLAREATDDRADDRPLTVQAWW